MKRKAGLVKMFNSQSGFCAYCRIEMTLKLGYSNTATRDHVVARARGGRNNLFNMVAACYECNQEKADKPLHEFLSRRLG